MKKLFVLLVLFLCGCSNNNILKCSYVSNDSIFGSKRVNDILTFKDAKIVSYKRNINFNLNSGIKDSRSVYKIIKLEGKALKKYIGGKYTIIRNSDLVSMSFSSKKTNNLKYIGIDANYNYEQVKSIYSDLGFNCE